MEIGVYLRREQTYDKMLKLGQVADELGYFGGFLNDHIHGFSDSGMEPYLEAWTAMTGIGVQTTNLRVGQIVLFNSLRNPAFLAKSVAALDNMTNGRYELLIGAGWNEPEYKGYDLMEAGSGMPTAGERVDRLEETLQILNLMLHNEKIDFDGKYWKLEGAINMPQPVQQPFRISVGAKGPRMMKITAKYATGLNTSQRTLTSLEDQITKFAEIVDNVGVRRLKDYYISGFSAMTIIDDENELHRRVRDIIDHTNSDLSIEEYLQDTTSIGTTEQIRDKLEQMGSLGISMTVASISVNDHSSTESLKYFKEDVLRK